MISNLNTLNEKDTPDAFEFFKMINGERYHIPESNEYSWYYSLGYAFANRYIEKHIRLDDLIPGSCEFVSFTPIETHLYQTIRVGNIITFYATKKGMFFGKGEDVFVIWYEGGDRYIELPLKDYTEDYISKVQEAVILEAELFNKRTSEYFSKLKNAFTLYRPKADGTDNGGRLKGYTTQGNTYAPKLVFPEHPTQTFMLDYDNLDKCYFEDVLFKISSVNDVTGKSYTKNYTVDDLSGLLFN